MNWITPDWVLPPGVKAAVTLRSGGVSVGGYASLNPALHVEDQTALVLENRQRIRQMLDLPSEPVWLRQVHGTCVVRAEEMQSQESVTADASFTHQKGVVCAVLTADCLPVFFCSEDGESIGIAHAGWRGLCHGILNETVRAMGRTDCSVWLGPAIGPLDFEVGAEVVDAFVSRNEAYLSGFQTLPSGQWLADLYQLARINLNLLGIQKIEGGHYSTFSDAERFYSYRRDGALTGRMASLIWRE